MSKFFSYGALLRAAPLAALALCGCTQYWAKPGSSPSEFQSTEAVCQSRAYSQLPPMLQRVQIGSAYVTPVRTSCTNYGYTADCVSTGGQYIPPSYIMVDQNESARNGASRSCLFSAGWRPFDKKADADAYARLGQQFSYPDADIGAPQ